MTAPDAQSAALYRQFVEAIRQRDEAAAEADWLRRVVIAGLCCQVAELEGELAAVRALAKAATA